MVTIGRLRPGGAAHLARENETRGERAACAVACLSRTAGWPPSRRRLRRRRRLFTQKGDNRCRHRLSPFCAADWHHQSPMRHVWLAHATHPPNHLRLSRLTTRRHPTAIAKGSTPRATKLVALESRFWFEVASARLLRFTPGPPLGCKLTDRGSKVIGSF